MKKITFILTLIIFTKISSLNAWALPACPSDPEEIWDNCQGEFTLENGDIYTGEWKNDEKHGQGTYTYVDGDIYTGEWKNEKMHGQGEFIYADGDIYTGKWINDEMHGEGTYKYESGAIYIGEMKNDEMHGQGTYTYANGDIYTGELINEKKHGQGEYTYESGGIYIGEWKNDEKHGQGEFIYADGYKVSTNNGILAPAEGLFKVVGNKLYYDTENSDRVDQIEFSHTDNLFDILKSDDQIKILVLNSTGGLTEAAYDMADLIIDAGLDTHTEGNCLSACVTIFLAGKNRSLDLGGKIGFHKARWAGSDLEDYYNSHKKDEKWEDPFEFSSWLYEDTQSDVFKKFEYLLERGVKPSFAIKTLRAGPEGMWKPRRTELISGGVLTQ